MVVLSISLFGLATPARAAVTCDTSWEDVVWADEDANLVTARFDGTGMRTLSGVRQVYWSKRCDRTEVLY